MSEIVTRVSYCVFTPLGEPMTSHPSGGGPSIDVSGCSVWTTDEPGTALRFAKRFTAMMERFGSAATFTVGQQVTQTTVSEWEPYDDGR